MHGRHRLALVRHGGARYRLRVSSLCADLQTFHATRKEPKHAIETYANKLLGPEDYIARAGRYRGLWSSHFPDGRRTRGSLVASQVSAGRKNRLSIEVYGTKSSAAWDQERPNELWIGSRDRGNQFLVKDLAASLTLEAMPTSQAATAKATTTPLSRCSAVSMHL